MKQKTGLIFLSIIALLGVVFYLDLNMPLGYAGGVPYVLPILLTWWTARKRWAIYTAVVASILTIAGYHISPDGGTEWIVLANRTMTILVIWVTAILIFILRQKSDDMDKALAIEHASSDARMRFIANLAHEIRTPINGLAGMSNLLQQTELDEKQRDYVQTLSLASDGLVSILTNLLDLSQMEEGEAELKPSSFQVSALMNELASTHRAGVEAKGLTLCVVDDAQLTRNIVTDRSRLYQVLNNFIANAAKFTEQGQITLGCTLMGKNADQVRLKFWVQDSGVGMTEKEQDMVFKRFTQVGQRASLSALGSGLGLSICKGISDLMQGEIGVTSLEGEGSTFFFELDCRLE